MRFSRLAREIYEDSTDLIEPFGLDEAWLDVTGSRSLLGSENEIADEIRMRVKQELGITASVGVSFNKIFAKLGSDMRKPDATTVLTQHNFRDRAWPLPSEDLLYVGPATQRKLYERGLRTIGSIAQADPELLHSWLGKWGLILHIFANGLDASPVRPARQESVVKSVGNSVTTPRDLMDEQDAGIVLFALAESVAARLREYGFKCTTVQVTFRDTELGSFDRQIKLQRATDLSSEIYRTAMQLLRKHYAWRLPLRSLAVRGCNLVSAASPEQLSIFDDIQRERQKTLEATVDDIRRRFGHAAIQRGVMLSDRALGKLNPKDDNTIHPIGFFN